MFANEVGIAERRGHQDVGLAAAPHQVARDFLTVAHHVLRGSGFVVHVAGVDVRAVIQQELRDLDRAGKMERRLAITAAGPRTTRPGFAPVCSPFFNTCVPLTNTCTMPVEYWCGWSNVAWS